MKILKEDGGLRIKDFENFNQVMLAKQGWILNTNTSSLIAHVIKDKYYKKFSFMEAKLGVSHFLIWRSRWRARYLLKEELKWIIGNEDY